MTESSGRAVGLDATRHAATNGGGHPGAPAVPTPTLATGPGGALA
jgi:hypothetical protein